jgi:hypothetical protein
MTAQDMHDAIAFQHTPTDGYTPRCRAAINGRCDDTGLRRRHRTNDLQPYERGPGVCRDLLRHSSISLHTVSVYKILMSTRY